MNFDDVCKCPNCGNEFRLVPECRPQADFIECDSCLYTGEDVEFDPDAEGE